MNDEELAKYKASNELRALIGKIPNLAVYIDEVHHATSDSIKLRTVVTEWGQNKTLNSVVGFSGNQGADARKGAMTRSVSWM